MKIVKKVSITLSAIDLDPEGARRPLTSS